MKGFFLAIAASAFLLVSQAQTLLPVRDSIGRLTISVDPRIELLGAVQTVAGYPLSTRDTPYSDSVKSYFGAFAGADAVKLAQKIYETKIDEIGYDGLVWRMLTYSYPPTLKQTMPCPEYLKEPAPIETLLRRYKKTLSGFVDESGFANFWAENEPYYRQLIDWCKKGIDNVDIAERIESYYGIKQRSYDIICCPLFGNMNWGFRLHDSAGGMRIYSLLSVPQKEIKLQEKDRIEIQTFLFHEFSHSFVNPYVNLYPDLVAKNSFRLEPIRHQMYKQGYEDWSACVIEHIVRAAVIRMLEITKGKDEAERRIVYEECMHFGYIRPLVAKLLEYEALRDSTGITFADYVPELLKVFSDAELYVPRFQGPVNAVLSGEKVLFVHPTVGDGAAKVTESVHFLVDWINSRSQLKNTLQIVADSAAVKMPLDNCSIVCYGTVESNLLLAKYRDKLPFRVEPGAIVADRRYDDPAVGLIACMPNPENPLLGMAVYTAVDEARIVDINNVFHGPDDFCIFTDRDHILSRGYFEKRGGEWRFPQPQP